MILSRLFPFITLAIGATTLSQGNEKLGQEQFQIHCIACHQIDQAIVGPSLVEVARLYQSDKEAFVKWSLVPGKKRPDTVQMPSMAHVGEDNLAAIHDYILQAAKGKKEKAPSKVLRKGADPFPLPDTRPLVQRMFLQGSGPATIAVALPRHEINFAFDAGTCRLRFVWQGPNFINAWPYWRGNGNAVVRAQGQTLYTEATPPFQVIEPKAEAKTIFLGYRLDSAGIPTFRYRRDGVSFTETITANPEGDGIVRRITSNGKASLKLTAPENATLDSNPETTVLTPAQASDFTLQLKW